MNNAEIDGIDNSLRPCWLDDLCDCPGGFFIQIDGVPNPNGNCIFCKRFKAGQLPKGLIRTPRVKCGMTLTVIAVGLTLQELQDDKLKSLNYEALISHPYGTLFIN